MSALSSKGQTLLSCYKSCHKHSEAFMYLLIETLETPPTISLGPLPNCAY